MSDLTIDPALWKGASLEDRLRGHFVDVWTPEGFKQFVAERREQDPTATLHRWCRRYDRRGAPVLGVVITWRGAERKWHFPLLNSFTAPDDGRRYLIFEARLKRIGLDFGIAVQDQMFAALQAGT